jgi:hypothetical protein
LTLTDGNNTTNFNPTDTTLNNLTVNRTSSFKNNVNLSTYNFDITNAAGNQGSRIFNNGVYLELYVVVE